ncbi:hypothetical protein [Microbacterium sp. 3J1]
MSDRGRIAADIVAAYRSS